MKYTESQLAGLTDEEREAILADDGQAEIGETDDGTGDDDGLDGADDESGGDGDNGDGDGDDEGEGGDDDNGGGQDDDDQPQPKDEPEAIAPLEAKAPDDAAERLAGIAASKDELATQFDDGEISAKEYQTKLDALNKQEREIELQQFKAELSEDMKEQNKQAMWRKVVGDFMEENPEFKTGIRYKALDLEVREIAAANPNMSDSEILRKAHENIINEFGLKPKSDDGKGRTKQRENPRDKAPPSLASLPAAEMSSTENAKFSMLNRLMEINPIRYEAELAKLSDMDREAYLMTI